ncbi:DSD1 family PLP-dependent enzyme [Pseudomaricurvus alkylphenolicus]|jgi:D-serine deaminase-like pyridoxal phosphate-dependent protein|uniref:DSD1 family PLP-dependent enzyme n=1 Tax=Pseudomaricurvus alkylphenolicus TaxID=1306991 RepID=UPI0014245631|nr:DSD1 family PLP-dependent enzyme [Pseudomaricurvus alkylphenolicus]NIB42553.1 DSD1 family PLP-dependent enzyme [Pseudomaricurvus alkylphenolicus]
MNKSRRKLITAGLGLGALATIAALRPGDRGASHNRYFMNLSRALDEAGLSKPTLVIDRQLMRNNITALTGFMQGRFDYRIVGKSLPSVPLLEEVMQQSGSRRLMMFHQPFLNLVARRLPHAEVLLGKPMPVRAAANFYQQWSAQSGFAPERQLQWLIDSEERLLQYQRLVADLKTPVNVNIELDVGFHRGGVQSDAELGRMLTLIEQDAGLNLSGFMGYEPHVAKLPGDKLAWRDQAMAIYEQRLQAAEATLGRSVRQLTLNGAGSPTYRYYDRGDFPLNELAAGSCLVKPSDFDSPVLAEHQPAAFIATPVLKSLSRTELPGPSGVSKAMALWNPNRQQTFYTYGGYWKAIPWSPQGLSINPLFGRSSNQEMYNGSRSVNLAPDDWMFFRPTQSESVFLQFGDIAVYEDGDIVGSWPVFSA